MMFRSFIRPLTVALSLAFATAAAAPAFAEDGRARGAEQASGSEHGKGKARGKGKDKKAEKSFPMESEKFEKRVDSGLTKAREKLSQALSKHNVAESVRTSVLKDFDAGATSIRAAAKRAGQDGSVTKAEAKEVRGLVKTLRKELKEKFLPKKNEKRGKDV